MRRKSASDDAIGGKSGNLGALAAMGLVKQAAFA
jgi:hypothetical protein